MRQRGGVVGRVRDRSVGEETRQLQRISRHGRAARERQQEQVHGGLVLPGPTVAAVGPSFGVSMPAVARVVASMVGAAEVDGSGNVGDERRRRLQDSIGVEK